MSLVDEVARPTEIPDCPYVGLRDFTETHAEFFFGRDGERKRIIGNLRASRLTVLYAESGVGKSSLLRAGVVPRLAKLFRRGQPTTGTRHLPVIFSTWSGDATNALIDAVADTVNSFEDIACELPRGSLMDAIEAAVQVSDATLLVILDQFEELFLYRTADSEDQIADELAALHQPSGPAGSLSHFGQRRHVCERRRALERACAERLRELPASRLPRPRGRQTGNNGTHRPLQPAPAW